MFLSNCILTLFSVNGPPRRVASRSGGAGGPTVDPALVVCDDKTPIVRQ